MSVFENVMKLGTFRSCRDEVIPRKAMGRILEAGRRAPSPGNVQSLEFIVVEDEHKREMLATAAGDERVEEAPTSVIVVADRDRMARRIGEENCIEACGAETGCAITNMRLVAEEEGVASCWISGFDKQMVADQFDIPDGKLPMGAIVLGYSDSEIPQEPRFTLRMMCYYDRYDNQITSVFDNLEWEGLRDETRMYGKKAKGLKKKIVERLHKFL